MKLLFVLPFAPYPLDSGGSQAIFNGIDVVKDDFEVFVAYRSSGQEEMDMAKFNALMEGKVKALPCVFPTGKPVKPTFRQRLYRLFFKVEKKLRKKAGFDFTPVRIPHRAWMHEELFPKDTRFAKHVCSIVDEYDINIVQCEMLCNVTIGMMLPEKVRKIFVHHELGWVVHELELQSQKGDAFEQKLYLDYYKMCEVALLNTYDDVITLSSIDTNKLLQAGVMAKVHTSLAVVNTPHDKLLSTERGNVLSFVGPDCNLPNVAGMKWFLDNVWEQLRQKDASYKLQIIGKWTQEHISVLLRGHENVEYLGFVEDLPSVVKDTIMIVPITIGSGIRMKILEAASMGIPFVTTSVGVEGIPVVDGRDCFIADAPEAFADAVIKLRDETLRRQFAQNAQRLAASRYSLDVLKENRLKIYREQI